MEERLVQRRKTAEEAEFARSVDFPQQPLMQNLRWARFVGDTVFMAGVAGLIWFVGAWVLERHPMPSRCLGPRSRRHSKKRPCCTEEASSQSFFDSVRFRSP